jgi:hypothetical protein
VQTFCTSKCSLDFDIGLFFGSETVLAKNLVNFFKLLLVTLSDLIYGIKRQSFFSNKSNLVENIREQGSSLFSTFRCFTKITVKKVYINMPFLLFTVVINFMLMGSTLSVTIAKSKYFYSFPGLGSEPGIFKFIFCHFTAELLFIDLSNYIYSLQLPIF